MKRLFFTASVVACLLSLSSFGSERNLPDALQSFYKTFRNAQNVTWTQVSDMLRIGFTMNGRQQFAYYSNDDLVVLATEITAEELPQNLKTQLSEYEGYVVMKTYELSENNMKEYCVVMQGASKHITLKGKKRWKVYVNEKI